VEASDQVAFDRADGGVEHSRMKPDVGIAAREHSHGESLTVLMSWSEGGFIVSAP
jgi:hypothetical protein